MAFAERAKQCLLFTTIYSFFICFIFNMFGWVLSYSQMTYEWKVLNLRQAKRAVFDTALIHFVIFGFCCFCYFQRAGESRNRFVSIRGSQHGLQQLESNQSSAISQ